MLGWKEDTDAINARVARIDDALTEILNEARAENESPVHAALRVVERRLAKAG